MHERAVGGLGAGEEAVAQAERLEGELHEHPGHAQDEGAKPDPAGEPGAEEGVEGGKEEKKQRSDEATLDMSQLAMRANLGRAPNAKCQGQAPRRRGGITGGATAPQACSVGACPRGILAAHEGRRYMDGSQPVCAR